MKFRSSLLIWIVLLIAVSAAATAGSAVIVLDRRAREELREDLARSARVFATLGEKRLGVHAASAHVVAEEPRLKAVVATEDVSPETVYGVAVELKKAVGSDLFLMTDGTGHLLADVADPKAQGFDMSTNPVIKGALSAEQSSGFFTTDGRVYEVVARRLSFGTTPVGVLVLGYALGDTLAEEAHNQTGSVVVVMKDDEVVASSKLEGGSDAPKEALAAIAKATPEDTGEDVISAEIGTNRYLVMSTPFGKNKPGGALRILLMRSLDRALAPARDVETRVAFISLLALLGAVSLGIVLSRRLSRPLDGLMAFVSDLGRGKLDARAKAEGPIELRALGDAMNRMAGELEVSRRELAAKERLEKELEISARIQTSILPRRLDVPGLSVAARMIPASEVGGDYYDVFPIEGGGILAIGDVAGHGLTSGLVMLMVQSAIATLGRSEEGASPKKLLTRVNAALYENIRNRLGNDEHVTLTVMRYERSGRVVFAGAHEDLLLCRAKTGEVEMIPTLGPWIGAMKDVSRTVMEEELRLEEGDVLVLYTDGITEARSSSGEQFGLERLAARVKDLAKEPVERIRDEILADVSRFAAAQEDDLTLVVVRYRAQEK